MSVEHAQARLVAEMQWWIAHEAAMDYAETRPIPWGKIKNRQNCATDCSGSICGIFRALGFEDPSGNDYGSGPNDLYYTGTMLTANDAVPGGPERLHVGDFVIYAKGPNTTHVCCVIQAGANPLLFSHGQDKGPVGISYADETAWHASVGETAVHFARPDLPADKPKPRWGVYRDGKKIGTAKSWWRWAARHPRAAVGHNRIGFRRRG